MAIHGNNESKQETGLSGDVVYVQYGIGRIVECWNVEISELTMNPLVSGFLIKNGTKLEFRERKNDWASHTPSD